MDRLTDLAEKVPRRLVGVVWAVATLAAITGTALILLAAVYGSVTAAIFAALAFGVAAVAWQVADRTVNP